MKKLFHNPFPFISCVASVTVVLCCYMRKVTNGAKMEKRENGNWKHSRATEKKNGNPEKIISVRERENFL